MKASEVAKALIEETRSQKSKSLSNLKLQKLLYYAQGWHLLLYNQPLFDDPIEAWIHGPVVPSVYRMYKEFTWKPITIQSESVKLPQNKERLIADIVQAYGSASSEELEIQTHHEKPWKNARNGIPADMSSNAVISEDSMREFFEEQATFQSV